MMAMVSVFTKPILPRGPKTARGVMVRHRGMAALQGEGSEKGRVSMALIGWSVLIWDWIVQNRSVCGVASVYIVSPVTVYL